MGSKDLKIQRLQLEIVNSDVKNYKSDETQLSAIVNESLEIALEQLDSVVLSNIELLSLERLVLDLGKIAWPLNKEKILQLIAEQLRSAINTEIDNKAQNIEDSTDSINNKNKSERVKESDVLLFFLKNGYLPWYANAMPSGDRLGDSVIISALKNFLLLEINETAIQRLIKHYNFKELSYLTFGLINTGSKLTLDELNLVIASLIKSENQEQKKVAKDLIRKAIYDLVTKSGKIKSLSEFMSEYFVQNSIYNKIVEENKIDYRRKDVIDLIKENITEAYQLHENGDKKNQVVEQNKITKDKRSILIHYLSFGSIPYGSGLVSKAELDQLLTEWILNGENELVNLFKVNLVKQEFLLTALFNLPEQNLKRLLNFIALKIHPDKNISKQLLTELVKQTSFLNVQKVVSSSVIFSEILHQTFSPDILQKHGSSILNASEREKMSTLLSEFGIKIESEKVDSIAAVKVNEVTGLYLSDLLQFVLQNRTWPWWAEKYNIQYGVVDIQNDFENALLALIKNFELKHRSSFIEFSKSLVFKSSKPSLIFSKISWETSKTILNAALPFNKNSFIETIEAVLNLIANQKAKHLNVNIATQQLVLFVIDKHAEGDFEFGSLMNKAILETAIKLNLPLWSIYGLISNNFDKLLLKNPFTIAELNSIFSYHEEMEEKYSEKLLERKKINDDIFINAEDFVFISDSHETNLWDYLSGKDAALNVFPSSWALGHFISHMIESSVSFRGQIVSFVNNEEARLIHRLLALEDLSGLKWVHNLLSVKENIEIQNNLFELLSDSFVGNNKLLINSIRIAFLKEDYWKDEFILGTKLGTFVDQIAKQLSIKSDLLEFEILSKLSANAELARQLKIEFDSNLIDAVKEKGSIVSLNESETFSPEKGLISNFMMAFLNYQDYNLVDESHQSILKVNNKEGLIEWIKTFININYRTELLNGIQEINDINQIAYSVQFFKTELARIQKSIAQNSDSLVSSELGKKTLYSYLRTEIDFPEKETLVKKIDAGLNLKQSELRGLIQKISNITIRSLLLQWLQSEANLNVRSAVHQSMKALRSTDLILRTIGALNTELEKINLFENVASDTVVLPISIKKSLLTFLNPEKEFEEKKALLNLIESEGSVSKTKVYALIAKISDVTIREKLIDLFYVRTYFLPKSEFYHEANELNKKNQIIETIELLSTKLINEQLEEDNLNRLVLSDAIQQALLSYLQSEKEFKEKKEIIALIASKSAVKRSDIDILINRVSNNEIKQQLIEFIRDHSSSKIISKDFETQVSQFLSNRADHLKIKLNRLIGFIKQQPEFLRKQEIIAFIEKENFVSIGDLIQCFEIIDEQVIKLNIIAFIGTNFLPKDFEHSEVNWENQKLISKMTWWKEKLGFQTSIVDRDVDFQSGITSESKINQNEEALLKKKKSEDLAQNAVIFSFLNDPILEKVEEGLLKNNLDSDDKKILNETPSILSETENTLLQQKLLTVKESTTITDPNFLSPNSIADVAIYFLLNLELPWWSSVKEVAAFEKILKSSVIKDSTLFKQKLIQTVKSNETYFAALFSILSENNDLNVIEFISREKFEAILKQDLVFLSLFFNLNTDYPNLKDLIEEIVLKFQATEDDLNVISVNFRKTVIVALLAALPETLKLLKAFSDKNLNTVHQSYLELTETYIKEAAIKVKQEKQAKLFLKALEFDLNIIGLEKGISVTDNLFLLYDKKNKLPIDEVINTWLQMLESITGSNSAKLKKDIKAFLKAKANEDVSFIEKELLKILDDESNQTEKTLLPYTNYLNGISLLLNQLDGLSAEQRTTSLLLVSRIFITQAANYNISMAFSVLFKYLQFFGLSKTELMKYITKLISELNQTEILFVLNRMLALLKDDTFNETYVSQSKVSNKVSGKTQFNVDTDIDELIRLISAKTTVLDQLQKQKLNRKDDVLKKGDLTKKTLELDLTGRIYIPNAGLVMLWPFLSRLFANLKYTLEGQFIDNEKRLRAIYLSQYLVSFTENNPEYTLMLNKLLCGMNLEEVIEEEVILTEIEKLETRNLLTSVLAQWKEMNNTSIDNFQRTFLQREGVMFKKDENWNIIVGKSTFDVLLLKLPWGISMIKYPWNKYLIFVEWKAMN